MLPVQVISCRYISFDLAASLLKSRGRINKFTGKNIAFHHKMSPVSGYHERLRTDENTLYMKHLHCCSDTTHADYNIIQHNADTEQTIYSQRVQLPVMLDDNFIIIWTSNCRILLVCTLLSLE